MKETWKIIENFTNYEISNLGHVRNIKTGRILKPRIAGNGYYNVMLKSDIDGKFYNCYIHRLVALAFISNPNNYKEVNHKDELKNNNTVENLEWCDRQYNVNYGTAMIRHAEKLSTKVYQYSLDGKFIKIFHSLREAERDLGVAHHHISDVCKGKSKSASGFIWRYDKI